MWLYHTSNKDASTLKAESVSSESVTSEEMTINGTEKQYVLPLCETCASTTPRLNSVLNDQRIQQHIIAFNEAMANIDWASYKRSTNLLPPSTTLKEHDHTTPSETNTTPSEPQQPPCTICATKRAIPLLTSLLVEVKGVWKEQTANISKAEKKALKSEVKVQSRSVKEEFKRAKREYVKAQNLAEKEKATVTG